MPEIYTNTDFLSGIAVREWTGHYADELMRLFFPLHFDGFCFTKVP